MLKYTAKQHTIWGWGGWEGLKKTCAPKMAARLDEEKAAL